MSAVEFTPSGLTYIPPQACTACGSKAFLIRRSPAESGEARTFRCNDCEHEETLTVSD